MDEYSKIIWKENPLDDVSSFLSKNDLTESYINKWTEETVSKTDLKLKTSLDKTVSFNVPGHRFYKNTTQLSKFDKSEHIKLINAHKLLTSGKKNCDGFGKEDLTFYNAVRSLILKENSEYLKLAQEMWNKNAGKKPLKLKIALRNYAIQERENKLKQVFNLPQYYKYVDSISYNYTDQDTEIDMFLMKNVLDVGSVANFCPPELMHTYIYKVKTLPRQEENVYNSKLPVSQDKHIEEIIKNNDVDIVISLTSIKKLIDFNGNSKQWIMPVVIKEIKNTDGSPGKKVIFVDKPLPKIEATHLDLNRRCSKLFARTNFCCMDGISFSEEILLTQNSGVDNEKCHGRNNASYKIWSLGQKVENSALIKGFKHLVFKVLIRTRMDACEINEQGNVLPVVVTPKLEYQLNYGASICLKSELAKEWAALFFQPYSKLYRVRSDYNTSEVIKIEPCSMQKINNEAFANHTFKPYLGLGVLYKVFYDLKQWPEGNYILNYKSTQGAFMELLQEKMDSNSFDLHNYYNENSKIIDDKLMSWSPIDINILLPIFEHNSHMCGLFTPCSPKSKAIVHQRNKKRKFKKKKGKLGKKIGKK